MATDAVVARLDELIAEARRSESALGYFPALYGKVTRRVAERAAAGGFDDGERMERLLTVFAGRYFEAYDDYRSGGRATEAWRVCFEAADDSSLIVLQHLLLGMNAHINLDLGIAAATVMQDAELAPLRGDFDRINEVLQSLIDDVNADLTQVWLPLRFLNRIGRRSSERVTDFSMRRARDHAWGLAERLSRLPPDEWASTIEEADRAAAELADLVTGLPARTRLLLWAIRFTEGGSVAERIGFLAD